MLTWVSWLRVWGSENISSISFKLSFIASIIARSSMGSAANWHFNCAFFNGGWSKILNNWTFLESLILGIIVVLVNGDLCGRFNSEWQCWLLDDEMRCLLLDSEFWLAVLAVRWCNFIKFKFEIKLNICEKIIND